MAVISGWIAKAQVKNAKRRQVPPAATFENPPGDDTSGSAWDLPDLIASLQETQAVRVDYTTFRRSRSSATLDGLQDLSRVCRCPLG